MAKALEEQRRSPDLDALSFEERVGLLVDREGAERDTKRLTTRLKFAALRQSACVEDVDLRTPRGIDRAVFAGLIGGGLDQPQRELAHHRGNRARQELDRLRPRPQGLPRQSFGSVSPRPISSLIATVTRYSDSISSEVSRTRLLPFMCFS
jgi:IstB-like ATP binding protein